MTLFRMVFFFGDAFSQTSMQWSAIIPRRSPGEIARPACLRAARSAIARSPRIRRDMGREKVPRAHICASSSPSRARRKPMQLIRVARSIQPSTAASSACRAMSRAFS